MRGQLAARYVEWQFFHAPRAIMQAWGNLLWFYLHYFSVGYLLKTLFSPWRKYEWSYGKGFNIQRFAESFISNLISRTLGAVIRMGIIFVGLVTDAVLLVSAAATLALWLLLPLLILLAFVYGFIVLV